MGPEELNKVAKGISGCRVIVGEIKSVLLTRIDDLLRWRRRNATSARPRHRTRKSVPKQR
jgi:hypothetical protein